MAQYRPATTKNAILNEMNLYANLKNAEARDREDASSERTSAGGWAVFVFLEIFFRSYPLIIFFQWDPIFEHALKWNLSGYISTHLKYIRA